MSARDRLLEATIQSLREYGYAATTTRRIVELAGLHVPAVNYYFGSKQRLMREAIVEAVRRWGDTTMAVPVDPSAPGTDQLRTRLSHFLGSLSEDRAYVVAAAEAFAQAERDSEVRDGLAEAYRTFRARVADSIAAANPAADPQVADALASTLIALFDGLAIQHLLDPTDTPSADQALQSLAGLAYLTTADPPGT